ncbi:hypothetical protein HK097_010327 [Rhizophlyctis rosea]|uniref:Uncharacterized protein n=1 Tax=Rhizophlyctis rosea TaxID=64517 RepID=A0AAD5X3X4_9FUNG|nr:hypothetical protein HK097_010327 [Rhizophlyctis rosea]
MQSNHRVTFNIPRFSMGLDNPEKFSDLMYEVGNYSKEEHISDHVCFVLKKLLYPLTANETEMEENLELMQVLADIEPDMFPLTHEEAVSITALNV